MEDKPRYSRISDILELLTLMQSRVMGITLADIQKEFKVSRRTAERLRDAILDSLPQVNELDSVGKEKHWGFISGHMKELIYFTPDEIANLETIKDSLQFEDRKKALDDVLNKLKAFSRRQITSIDDRIELLMRTEGVAVSQKPDYKIDIKNLDIVRQAITENRKITAKYNGKKKILYPYGIIYGSDIYLVSGEGKYTNPYVYKMHKLSDIILTRENFDKGDFDIKEYASKSFGVYQNEAYKVEVLFSQNVAEDVLNYNFHPTQKVKQNEDGTVTVKFKASGDLEILWHLFRWGNNAKIISPKNLKTHYIQILEDVLQVQKM